MTAPSERVVRPGIRLGVDVGSVRVGLSRSDPTGRFASPVATLTRDTELETDIAQIAELVTAEHVIEVVVGLPLLLSGERGAAADTASEYATQLATRIAPCPVRLVDERLSTVDAHRQLRDTGRKTRSHRAVVDQVAATVILQSALDAEAASGRAPGEAVRIPPFRRAKRKQR